MLEHIDHVNLVVQDLAVMVEFYCQVLDMQEIKRVVIKGQWLDHVAGLESVEANVVYLSLPAGPRIELIEYVWPSGVRPEGLDKTNTMGLRHIAFRVSDIDATVEVLETKGVRLLSKITAVPSTQVAFKMGQRKRLVYFLDPEQNLLELCEYRSDR